MKQILYDSFYTNKVYYVMVCASENVRHIQTSQINPLATGTVNLKPKDSFSPRVPMVEADPQSNSGYKTLQHQLGTSKRFPEAFW